MLSKQNFKQLEEITEQFFIKLGFACEIEFLEEQDNTVPIILKMDEPQILIGQQGERLLEIQHLLKAILKRKIKDDFYIDLDINDYKKKKVVYLKELAREAADDAALTKKERVLGPLPAYERRIIHLELAERSDITTESIGLEPERKIIIKPLE